jgi:Uma2 family endonuclease
MATTPKITGLTYEDLQAFPDDRLRREIIDGELFVTPSLVERHQYAVSQLIFVLVGYQQEHGGRAYPAPLDVVLSDANVVEPDVLFILPEHLERLKEDPWIRFPPDLTVEVSSPGTRKVDLTKKKELYERFGVRKYWFVDLDVDNIVVYRLREEHYSDPDVFGRGDTLGSPILPGFSASVDDILGPPQPAES